MFPPVSLLLVLPTPNPPTSVRCPPSVPHSVDLHKSLKRLATDPTRPGEPATIRCAARVLSCDCDAGVITLENGETIQGDLIVGADGMYVDRGA